MSFRLAMVTPYPEKDDNIKGGVEGVSHCLTHALQKVADLDLHILAPCGQRKPGIEQRDGMMIHWLPMSKLPGFISYWTSYRLTIHQHLKKINPDVVHFQGVAGWTLGYTKPYVLTIHGIAEKDVLYSDRPFRSLRYRVVGLVERLGRSKSSYIIEINPYVRQELGDQIKGRLWPINNPVMSDFFSIRSEYSTPRILFAGHISSLKNVDGLIRAFSFVHGQIGEARLFLAGIQNDREFHDKCMKEIKKYSLSRAVCFLGNLDRKALQMEMAKASCFALLSHQEVAPLVVAEAMAAGLPVVASRLQSLSHMVEEGKTGFLVDQNNEREVADRLIEVLQNRSSHEAMRKRSRVVALERFHPLAVAKKTLEVYRGALRREEWSDMKINA